MPGTSDDVTISIAVTNPITHGSSQSDFVHSITSSDPIVVSGGASQSPRSLHLATA